MAYLNADYWKKAYLLEFRLNNRVQAAFTFSVPPESEDFVFPQRKNETKTFGGAVIADYGNDLVQINLSGSTINQELKIIYKSSFGIDLLTGEQEIFYLRDLLKEYGSQANLKGKTVYLYSLNGERSASTNPKWWQIFVGQLDISRNKDKPFCYNYKFSVIAAPEVKRLSSDAKRLNLNVSIKSIALESVFSSSSFIVLSHLSSSDSFCSADVLPSLYFQCAAKPFSAISSIRRLRICTSIQLP